MTKCCGFCKHYCHVDDGVTVYRGHIVQIGYCPNRGETLEIMDILAKEHDPILGNWDEEYRWASHASCNDFELDKERSNEPSYQYLKTL